MTALDEVEEFIDDHALSAGPVAFGIAKDVVVSFGKFDGFFDGEEEAAFRAEAEVLMLYFDKAGGGNFPAFISVDADSNLTAAGEAAFFFPKTAPFGGFKVFGNDGVFSIL